MPAKKSVGRARPERTPSPYFGSVAVVVSDRDRAAAWYTGRLGLDVLHREKHWITVGRKGRNGALHLCQTSELEPGSPLEPGNTGILLLVPGPDFRAECTALKARGVEFTHDVETAEWGTWAMVRDPDGNEFCLMPAD